MSSLAPTFTFQSFDSLGVPRLALHVTPEMLPAQRHLLPVIDSIERVLASGGASRRLNLNVEDAEPFDVEFSRVGTESAVARFFRGDMDSLRILLADATGGVDPATMKAVEQP